MKWVESLSTMTGRLALAGELEAELLAEVVRSCRGDHVEIGCLWGGTAIIAALAKAKGDVHTIDPMTGGWWDTQDPMVKQRPTPAAVLDNFQAFGVAHKIHIIKAMSNPWPLPAVTPDSIFIDGDHRWEGCSVDWRNAARLARKYILVHDYGTEKHPGVKRTVEEIAKFDPEWSEVCKAGTLIVFERITKSK